MKVTPRLASFFRASQSSIALAVAAVVSFSSSASATDGVWNSNSSTTWSTPGNWTSSNIADGIGSTADFSLLNITGSTRTVTIDGAIASRTVGTLLIGDSDIADNRSYTIAASGGGTLTFDKSGTGAMLSQISTSFGDSITVPVSLNDNLTISNAAAVKSLTLSSGGISSGTAGTKTLTTSTGNVTISGNIGDGIGTVAVVQDGVGTLTLSGVNIFTGGLTVKNGTVIAGNSASTLGGVGTGAVTIGGGVPSGAANASLLGANGLTYANPITVASGGTGLYTIGNSLGVFPRFSGAITLNNNLTIAETNNTQGGISSGTYLIASGGISGSGNLTLAGNGAISTNNQGQPSAINNIDISGPVSTTGSITNSGTGNALVVISGIISNASGLTQNSATSMLTLSAANTYTGATNINAGVLRIQTSSTAISNSSAVNVASGATLQFNGQSSPNTAQTLTISGNGTAYTGGALECTSSGGYLGNVVLAAHSTISGSNANNTLTVGTVGATTITGSGKNLTTTGSGSVTLSGSLDTGAGTLTKTGTGLLTLSGANSFTGLTSINQGTVVLNIATALNGGGNITFGGGTLRYTASNNVDYSSRIINSTGPISIDTNSQNRTLSGGLAASNTGGLTKIGSGTLTLSGTNSYTGPTTVIGGQLAISDTSALPDTIFADATGAVNQDGAYTGVQGWLDSDKVATGSTGAIALTGASSENIEFTGFNNLMLGASTGVNYTGTITPAGGTYRLGGGSGTITLPNTNAVTGANTLVVGARSGNSGSGGGVTFGAANNLTGTTTVASSTLTLNSGTAGLATSDITVNRGATLVFNYAAGNLGGDNNVTRAKSIQFNGATLNVSGNTGGNSTETITNALTFTSGQSSVNVSSAAGKHALLSAGGFTRITGSTVLFTGTSLGVNANSATDVSSANVSFGTAPTLNGTGTAGGSGGTTTVGILAGAYGDTTYGIGTGLGTTGGLVTYDSTNGVRLLNTGTEYISAIASGQTQLDNVRYDNSTASLVTTTLGTATSINSLSFASTGTGGVTIDGTGALKINSGVVYNAQIATNNVTISNTGGLDFNGQEAILLNQNSGTFTINTVIGNATGLTKSGSGMLIFSGTDANTYTGTTTVNGGNLRLSKTAGVNAVTGDLVINTGANVTMGAANQIVDTSNVTINGGTLVLSPSGNNNGGVNETINNLTMINGANVNYGQSFGNPTFTVLGTASVTGGSSLFQNAGGQLNITGLTSLSDGGTLTVRRSQTPASFYDGFVTLTGGLAITNTPTGAYTPVTISPGINIAQLGGKLFLNGDLTFTGNSNPNTVTIAAPTGSGPQGVMALGGDRTLTIANGAAAIDLTITAALVDSATPGGLVKTGAGTLALTGANTYTGNTTVSAGTLSLGTATLSNTGKVDVATSATLNLAHSLTDTVDEFYINGVLQVAGEWGSLASDAAHKTARITGSGKLYATNGTVSSDPFIAWIDTYTGLTNPADKTKTADPDMDGLNNLAEFAIKGNPDNGSDNGLTAMLLQDTTAPVGNELTYIIAVRDGASFASGAGGVQTASIVADGLTYTIEGSLNLVFPDSAVSHVSTSSTAPAATGLPNLTGTAWEYHTFRLNASEGLSGKGFLRVVTQPTP